MFKKIVKSVALLFILLGLFFVIGGTNKEEPKLEKLNIYRGNLIDYHVIIEEIMKDGVQTMLVNLELINDKETALKPLLITGYYNADDGQFKEIFIREKEKNGYNFTRSKDGWTWSPYPTDKDKPSPFTFEQIACAQKKLRLAMNEIHNTEHLYKTLENLSAKKK